MKKLKLRGLKWQKIKLRGLVLDFGQEIKNNIEIEQMIV